MWSVIAPPIADVIRRRLVHEVVLLLGAAILIGPNVLGLAGTDQVTSMFLGLGMLYLLLRCVRCPGDPRRTRSRDSTLDDRDSLRMGLCFATGLKIIVAVTTVAVSEALVSLATSVLVAGAALTSLMLPMAATLLDRMLVPPLTPPAQPRASAG